MLTERRPSRGCCRGGRSSGRCRSGRGAQDALASFLVVPFRAVGLPITALDVANGRLSAAALEMDVAPTVDVRDGIGWNNPRCVCRAEQQRELHNRDG